MLLFNSANSVVNLYLNILHYVQPLNWNRQNRMILDVIIDFFGILAVILQ